MTSVLHYQLALPASPAEVFRALTENAALETWFAEHADVSLKDKRYDFWGRFTPESPARTEGHHPITAFVPNRQLSFRWQLRGVDTTVDLKLTKRHDVTVLGLWHRGVPSIPEGEPGWYALDDVWALWLENLRRYLDGRSVIRCDFSAITGGDVTRTIEIDAPASAVWDALVNPEQRKRWIASKDLDTPDVGGVWIDWAQHGALRIVEMVPEKRMSLEWQIGGVPTVVTWTLEEQGGKTRFTLAHSGFAPDYRTDGELLGWLSYLSWLQSLVEYGFDWLPPVKQIARDVALFHAASIWSRQDELLDEDDASWR